MVEIGLIYQKDLKYCEDPPFHPSIDYPEYPFNHFSQTNDTYEAIRCLFKTYGFDLKNYGSKNWNPLGSIVTPGDSVLIKPNMVFHENHNKLGGIDELITHGSIIRAVLDYVCVALGEEGTVTIGDAPLQAADFEKITIMSGLDQIISFYENNSEIDIKLVDFREEVSKIQWNRQIIRETKTGDPNGYINVDLAENSEFFNSLDDNSKYRITNYDPKVIQAHHSDKIHEYRIAKTCLQSDVIINLPKLKTHKKAGMTGAMKNFVGINGSKAYLPHHRSGSYQNGCDEYLHNSQRKQIMTKIQEKIDCSSNKVELLSLNIMYYLIRYSRFLISLPDPYFEGSWYGNDTISRTIVDLNKIILYSDKTGKFHSNSQRKIFSLIDGIIAGEGEGPLHPSPKKCGILICGINPVAVDLVCCKIMGFDSNKIPTLVRAQKLERNILISPNDIETMRIKSNIDYPDEKFSHLPNLNFEPASGWKGHIEADPEK